jgi:hypothetical protein
MKEIGLDVLEWSELVQDRGKWQVLVYVAMNLRVIQNMRNSWLTGKLLAFRKLVCSYELVVWSVGQSFCQSVGWSVGWLVGWLSGQSGSRLVS